MAKITLTYDEQNSLAVKTLKYILSLGVFKKVSKIEESLKEVEEGKVNEYENTDDFFKQVVE